MSEVSRNAHAYTIQEENSTAYCTPRSHPGKTPTAGPRCGRRDRLLVQRSAHRYAMERSTIKHGIVHLSLETHAPVDPGRHH